MKKNVFKFGTFELSKGFLYGDFNALPSSECLFCSYEKGWNPLQFKCKNRNQPIHRCKWFQCEWEFRIEWVTQLLLGKTEHTQTIAHSKMGWDSNHLDIYIYSIKRCTKTLPVIIPISLTKCKLALVCFFSVAFKKHSERFICVRYNTIASSCFSSLDFFWSVA